ncbi:Beta-galactosidase 3 [Trifolium repens]|nr:Beta-galactosidase 3 [Trifolium repens]
MDAGLIREPKYGHLKELHKAIKMCERALVSTDPIITSLGSSQQAHVYSTESGDCAAFLSKYDSKSPAKVLFNNMHYSLPPWSVSILPDCRNSVFNTAKVGVQTSQMQMLPTNTHMFSWESFDEDISSLDDISSEQNRPPNVHLHCSPGQTISSIKFGTPLGTCGNYVQGACHSPTSYAILEKKCVGKPRCIVTVSNSNFRKDPCPRVMNN